MTEHDNADLLAARAAPRAGLGVAAVAFTVIGLAGPLMLAIGIDPRPYAWIIAPLWVVVIGGVLVWLRGFLRRLDAARTARDRDASPRSESRPGG
jgi:hypothetical protein